MTLSNTLQTFALAACALTFAACDATSSGGTASPDAVVSPTVAPNSIATVVDPAAVVAPDGSDVNREMARVAKATARLLADPAIRGAVHSAAVARFDGETNVLVGALDAPVSVGALPLALPASFTSLLTERAEGVLGIGLTNSSDVRATIDGVATTLGGPAHLYWADADQVGPEQAPLVTFTPVGIDPDDIQTIIAYDADGNEHVVDDAVAAERPVVAYSYNERVSFAEASAISAGTLVQGGLLDGARVEENCYDGFECGGGGTGGGGTGGGGTGGGGTGGDGTTEYGCGEGLTPTQAGTPNGTLTGQVRLDYVCLYHDYEGFTMGGPELRVQVVKLDIGSDTTTVTGFHDLWASHYIDDSWADGRPILFGKNLAPWNTDDNPTLSFKWTEVDGSTPQVRNFLVEEAEFDLPDWAETAIRVVDYLIKKAEEDEDLGKADVDYDPSLPMYYGIGTPDFGISRNS